MSAAPRVDVARIQQLIDVVAEEGIDELEVELAGLCVRIARDGDAPAGVRVRPAQDVAPTPQAAPITQDAKAPAAAAATHLTAPTAGTFYRSAQQGGEPFVAVGAVVAPGTPLCVIEAMKIMSEVVADRAGTVTQVLCESGQMVEYGQPLFVIA